MKIDEEEADISTKNGIPFFTTLQIFTIRYGDVYKQKNKSSYNKYIHGTTKKKAANVIVVRVCSIY